jgi:hypothetical protein
VRTTSIWSMTRAWMGRCVRGCGGVCSAGLSGRGGLRRVMRAALLGSSGAAQLPIQVIVFRPMSGGLDGRA